MLKVLPQNISNLIAAGEVVSRPASVVKELVENAIDAGATNVSVIVSDAGRTMIQVIDNGCGMSSEEAVLCFERHATSKISEAGDLEHILTYGFRGEALASIAAVAQVTLKTRRQGEEVGTKVEVAESQVSGVSEAATPYGSRFEIRNLFYNVPARRKFLKSDAVELRNIIQEFLRIALIRPSVAMKLVSNGKEIYNLHPTDVLKKRIQDVYGMNLAKGIVPVQVNTSVIRLTGFIGNPEDALKRQNNQFFFVNGRYFRSAFFNKAVCKPYEKLIPEGYSPAYFIYMELEPEKTDVNIHPAKTEIKFEDEAIIFEILEAAVREGIGKNDFTPSIDFDTKGAPEFPVFEPSSREPSHFTGYSAPSVDYTPLFNPFEEEKQIYGQLSLDSPSITPSVSYGHLFEEQSVKRESRLLLLHKKLIVTPVKSGMMVIDIRRARQRIFYEQYLQVLIEGQNVTQQTLFPQTIELSTEDYITLMEQPDLLERLGFDIRDFGQGSVVVYGLPDGYSADSKSIRESIDSLVAALRDDTSLDDTNHLMAARMAERAAACGSEELNCETAQMLVDKLFACREPNLSPDGHRCVAIITIEEIEKKL
ncbi:MAG: DNA mismatch repair endonuclease MutL [Bacteroidales bacterium]|nr:DNA mismatch repair endonuclease MutL [Candidatus Cacconaster merdequi]